jgi:predicted DNA-binding WGR domain protein
MDEWYLVRLAPRDGTPVILWIGDEEAPPAYPVTVGAWETDDITRRSYWRVFAARYGTHLLRSPHRRLAAAAAHSAKPRRLGVGQSQDEIREMSIYWTKIADVYPDGGYDDSFFMAFDPEARFPRFHMETGDETIGNVHLIKGGFNISRRGRSSIRAMPDELQSPIKLHLVLHRIDPEQGIRRFYSLMIERDLFGTVRLVRNWGWIGSNGQELVEVFPDEIEAGEALEALAQLNRRRGYRDL